MDPKVQWDAAKDKQEPPAPAAVAPRRRKFGRLPGEFKVCPEFFEPLPKDEFGA